MISNRLVEEFQTALREDYGKDVELAEARTILEGAVKYYDLLGKIYHRSIKNENGNINPN